MQYVREIKLLSARLHNLSFESEQVFFRARDTRMTVMVESEKLFASTNLA